MHNFNSGSKLGLGSFLSHLFLEVVSDIDSFFKKHNSITEILKAAPSLPNEEQLKVTKFCALSLELFNCAQRFSETHSKKSVNPYTELFFSSNFNKKKFDDFISKFKMEIVYTAHPTEVFTLPVMKNIHRIERDIEKLSKSESAERKDRILKSLQAELTTLWLTDGIYREKPTPEDESRRLTYIFESSLWKSSPYFFKRYHFEYNKYYHSSPKSYPNIQFSSWIGGDKDGNPFVTHKSTLNIITRFRRKVLRLILLELYPLRDETLIKTSQKKLQNLYPDSIHPYKSLFIELIESIQFTLKNQGTKDIVKLEAFITKKLSDAYSFLCLDGAKKIADRRLRSLIDRIKTFSLSPFKLDLRQDSEVHTQILEDIQKHIKGKTLTPELARKVPFLKLSKESQDFFKTMKLVSDLKPRPFNCYIISMTRSVQDIKNLHLLLEIAEVKNLPVVPLFETPDDIKSAHSTITKCKEAKLPLTQIMWGYSDSTKRGGRLSSAWNLYKMQKKVFKDFPNLIHFHGRGGSIARGGGDLSSVFGTFPAGVINHHFRQTFQGEVIQDQFGLYMRTVDSLEKLLKECTLNHFKPIEPTPKDLTQNLDKISEISEERFKKLFYVDGTINQAFEKYSPVSVINSMNLGSRPTKRVSKKKGVSYRAIPWVFSWSQTRAFLPIWFGLQNLEKELLKFSKKSDFLKSLILLLKEGLSLSSYEVFHLYFKNYKSTLPHELEQLHKNFKINPPIRHQTQNEICSFLHTQQSKLLKKNNKKAIEDDIAKITAQGIATYLGKSG